MAARLEVFFPDILPGWPRVLLAAPALWAQGLEYAL